METKKNNRDLESQNYLPRVLIVSNECLSNTNSNGRTLRNFFLGWPREKLAQFYIKKGVPDFDVCANYYCLTDAQALRAMLGRKIECGEIKKENCSSADECPEPDIKEKYGRNALTMLAREIVWESRAWEKQGIRSWILSYQPEVVVLQAGDCGFMYEIAVQISRQFGIPLLIYNSESYYFNDFDYFRAHGLAHVLYPFFRINLRRKIKKAIKQAGISVYICETLEKAYWKEFHAPSATIYTATESQPEKTKGKNSVFAASYLGNFGLGRHEPLIEIADALHAISDDIYLDVYGRIPNEEVKEAFDNCQGIRYKGFVSYQDVRKIMAESDLLVHAENFSKHFSESLQFAFSTKIADSLASGTCFLLYAPGEMACTEYLKENKAAYVVDHPEKLKDTLQEIVSDKAAREKYINNALELVERNHSASKNSARFQAIIREVVGNRQ